MSTNLHRQNIFSNAAELGILHNHQPVETAQDGSRTLEGNSS